MSREKKLLPDIRVSKLPNGYAFTYEGEEFMCFSPMMLVAEVMARVGGANSDEMDKGSLLHSLFEVMLGQQYAKDVDKLKATGFKPSHTFSEALQYTINAWIKK